MESEKSGFVNKMSEIWRKMQVKFSNIRWKFGFNIENGLSRSVTINKKYPA